MDQQLRAFSVLAKDPSSDCCILPLSLTPVLEDPMPLLTLRQVYTGVYGHTDASMSTHTHTHTPYINKKIHVFKGKLFLKTNLGEPLSHASEPGC